MANIRQQNSEIALGRATIPPKLKNLGLVIVVLPSGDYKLIKRASKKC